MLFLGIIKCVSISSSTSKEELISKVHGIEYLKEQQVNKISLSKYIPQGYT